MEIAKIKFFITVFISILFASCTSQAPKTSLKDSNIIWESQSKNAFESMPLDVRGIGCNVWLENGDVMPYVQRSGSLNENG